MHKTTNFPKKLMVFLGLRGDGSSFSLKFMNQGTITSDSCYKLLRFNCIPQLKAGNEGTLGGLWWQQDDASPHRTQKMMRYLDNQFGQNTLAMGSISGWDWAARSPDMNPLDFFAWGYLKSKVFEVGGRPQNMAEMKAKITRVVNKLVPDMNWWFKHHHVLPTMIYMFVGGSKHNFSLACTAICCCYLK